MSEKRKWFDSRRGPTDWDLAPPLRYTTFVPAEQAEEFVNWCRGRGKLEQAVGVFSPLAKMPSAVRLSRNLKQVFSVMATTDPEQVYSTLSAVEHRALGLLAAAGASTEHQEVAQLLLNVYERQQLLCTWQDVFRELRNRSA